MKKRILALLSNPPQTGSSEKNFFEEAESNNLSFNKTETDVAGLLRKCFEYFQVDNLSIDAEEFYNYIQAQIGTVDAEIEGYSHDELERQRDLSIKFHWGHNHDFGSFKLDGRMGDRHIDLLTIFVTNFPISLSNFEHKMVFDIGCWTGGTTLLLASLGSQVLAIEEVKKYADMTSFLVKSFGLSEQVSVKSTSIYKCNTAEYYDLFDIVYFPGVIYHLSDPLLALWILFNSLKTGGIILVESLGINREEPFFRFDGSLIYSNGSRENLNRTGWNWFIPTPSALNVIMKEAGFDDVKTLWHSGTERVYGYGKKVSQVGICKAGLSVPEIR